MLSKAISKKKQKQLIKKAGLLWAKYWPTFSFAFLSIFMVAAASSDQRREEISAAEAIPAVMTEVSVENLQPWDFFRPAWKQSAAWNVVHIRANTADTFSDTTSENHKLVDDPEDRIEKEFKVPKSIRSQVLFWMDIYSRFSSRTRVVHDRADMDLIYGYIDFRPLYKASGSHATAAAKANQIENRILKDLKAKISEASGLTNTKLLSMDEKEEIQSFLSKHGGFSKTAATNLIGSVRTQSGQSDMFLMALYRSRQLLPHIESVFKQNELPISLARIPFVESSFNARAQSSVGAVGIWQMMPETARQMISEDEKLWSDPLRQTRSVVKLLKIYRSLLPDWGTTVTAYNSGVGRLQRIVKKYSIRRGEELAQIPNVENTGLGFAGRNFYSEFLAANLVEAYKEEIFEHLLVPTRNSVVMKGKESPQKEVCDL